MSGRPPSRYPSITQERFERGRVNGDGSPTTITIKGPADLEARFASRGDLRDGHWYPEDDPYQCFADDDLGFYQEAAALMLERYEGLARAALDFLNGNGAGSSPAATLRELANSALEDGASDGQ